MSCTYRILKGGNANSGETGTPPWFANRQGTIRIKYRNVKITSRYMLSFDQMALAGRVMSWRKRTGPIDLHSPRAASLTTVRACAPASPTRSGSRHNHNAESALSHCAATLFPPHCILRRHPQCLFARPSILPGRSVKAYITASGAADSSRIQSA